MNNIVIGDVHARYQQFHNLIDTLEYDNIIQVGDMGFDYSELERYDPNKLKFIPGNHDNYDICYDSPYCLGDYGNVKLSDLEFFFIRGGFSIDKKYRINHEQSTGIKSWWRKEELSLNEAYKAFDLYQKTKPEIMITHSCPLEIAKIIGNPMVLHSFGFNSDKFTTRTQELLQACFEDHKPKLHIFGHFHRSYDFYHKSTRFICLPELGYINMKDLV